MTEQKKKIAFSPTPVPPVPSVALPQPAEAEERQEVETAREPLFDREAWERTLVPPAIKMVSAVTQPPSAPQEPHAAPGKHEDILSDIARTRAATPKAPGFAATGLMAAPQPGFVQRNALLLGSVGGVFATLIIGLTAVFWMMDRPQTLTARPDGQTYDPVEAAGAPEAETATRTALADLTGTGETGGLRGGGGRQNVETAALSLPAQGQAAIGPEDKVRNAMEILDRTRLRQLREAVLAGGYSVEVVDVEGVLRARLQTSQLDLTDETTAELLEEAAAQGQIDIAPALRTPDGGFDFETLMFSLIQTSLQRDQAPASVQAAREMSRKVFAASPLRTEFTGGLRTYTVRQGDSLAYIALQLFGVPNAYTRILSANADTLQSPDQIRIGQRLIIPS